MLSAKAVVFRIPIVLSLQESLKALHVKFLLSHLTVCSKYKIVSQEKLSVNHFVHNPFLFISHHQKWFIDTQITFHSSIFPLTLFYLYGLLCIFLHACQLQIHHSHLHKKVKQTHKHGKVVSIFQCNCRLLARKGGGL